MLIGAEDAATIPALQSGKVAHARHPTQARGRARDAVEFRDMAATVGGCGSRRRLRERAAQCASSQAGEMPHVDVIDLAPGLWIWRLEHPAWTAEVDWQQVVTCVCVD